VRSSGCWGVGEHKAHRVRRGNPVHLTVYSLVRVQLRQSDTTISQSIGDPYVTPLYITIVTKYLKSPCNQ